MAAKGAVLLLREESVNKTGIEWCDFSWNPITGCESGLQCWNRCYARRMALRLAGRAGYDHDDPFKPTFHEDKLEDPLRRRKPSIIFCCSMGDMFADEVEDSWRSSVWGVMRDCPQHTFIVLTKRPQNISAPEMDNLWLGISAEDQAAFDLRWPLLCERWMGHRIVSLEPLLGAVDMTKAFLRPAWVIAGPETGPGAREWDIAHVENINEYCVKKSIAFFWKGDRRFGYSCEWPAGMKVT